MSKMYNNILNKLYEEVKVSEIMMAFNPVNVQFTGKLVQRCNEEGILFIISNNKIYLQSKSFNEEVPYYKSIDNDIVKGFCVYILEIERFFKDMSDSDIIEELIFYNRDNDNKAIEEKINKLVQGLISTYIKEFEIEKIKNIVG